MKNTFVSNVVGFADLSCASYKYYKKLVNFAVLDIFCTLRHFATEFCNFTNFRMLQVFLFLAMMKFCSYCLHMSIVNKVLADQAAFPTLWVT